MRPLTEEETKIFFEKLAKYIGRSIKNLIDRSDATYCFRLHNQHGTALTCDYLVVATALAVPHVPRMEGIEHAEGYESVDVRPEAYTDQRVLVLGLGNSAFETAIRAQSTAGFVHLVGRSRGGLR